MAEGCIPECHGEDAFPISGSQSPLVQFETSVPFQAPSGVFNGGVNQGLPLGRKRSPGDSALDILWRCKTRQNLTGASLPQIRRGLAHAWRLMLASQINEAV